MATLSRTICALAVLLTAAVTDARPTASLITVGPGDEVWERFGHNMIRVRDDARGIDACFNWGLFDFDKPNFVANFVRGRMLYTMAPLDTARSFDLYRGQNRHATEQRLDLTPGELRTLIERCDANFRVDPDYRYDYFKDNCSTRVRDMIDGVTGGVIAAAAKGVPIDPPVTYRHEAVRLTRDDFWVSLGIDFAGGPNTDKPLDRWAECFVPSAVSDEVQAARPGDAPRALWLSTRPPPPAAPPVRWPGLLAVGGAWAAAILWTGRRVRVLRAAGALRRLPFVALRTLPKRLAWAPAVGVVAHVAPVVLWWLAGGLGGVFMACFWAFTDHTAAYANQNLWHFSPLAWLALGLAAIRRHRAAWRVSVLIAAGSLAGVGVWAAGRFGGPFAQANGGFILLALPANLAAAWATRPALTKPRTADDMAG